jgi:2-methylcitrate dehydratase PrpD
MTSNPTVAERLAAFVTELDCADLPRDAIRYGKTLLLDQLGCQLLGSTVEWNQTARRFIAENKSGGPAAIVNFGKKVPLDDAVFVNGTFAQGCELDDYYDQGGGHPGAATVPVGLALSQRERIDGKQFLAAMAAGYEVGWRIGRALLPEMMRRGYHAQGVVGVFIATAMAGKLLHFDFGKMTHALAIAGSHASGTMEYDQSGGEVKRVHNGIACAGGMRSALLAAAGLTGPPTIFEGERGILRVFSGVCNTAPIVESLGSGSAVLHAAIKQFPVNASQHSPIELLDLLMNAHRFTARQVEKIEVGVNEAVTLHSGTIYEPTEVIEAQFSLRFSLAIRLLKGSNNLEHYLNSGLWRDPEVLALGKKINLYADPSAHKEKRFACRMKVFLAGGNVAEGYLPAPKGSFQNPLSEDQVREKFISLGSAALPRERLDRIVEKVENIEFEEDVSTLAMLLSR